MSTKITLVVRAEEKITSIKNDFIELCLEMFASFKAILKGLKE